MTEADIHKQIVDWMRLVLPKESVFHHSPNEARHPVKYRMKQIRMGMRAGWPDLEIFVPPAVWHEPEKWRPIFLEVKTKKGRVTEKQEAVHTTLKKMGCEVAVVRSIDDVVEFLSRLIKINA